MYIYSKPSSALIVYRMHAFNISNCIITLSRHLYLYFVYIDMHQLYVLCLIITIFITR